METKKQVMTALASAILLIGGSSCASHHYEVTSIERSRILIDQRYDAYPDAAASAFLAPYKQQVDSLMSPVVGTAERYMEAYRPESELSNLACDILVWGGKAFDEKPVFSVYNMGGIRAALAKGKVTTGDVLDMAPFENKICFMTLTGTKVLELFQQIAHRGGEGVSHAVRLVISKDYKLVSATINGEAIDPNASYRVATLDYLAEGNDGLTAFRSGTDVVSPKEEKNNVRYIIMDYFRQQTAQGKTVDAKKEGRITIE